MKTFFELGVAPEIIKATDEMGYVNPMPVQEEVIPYLLGENNDIVALAQTGTGKTAAFGLPLIQKTNLDENFTQSLILCPTRELCLQIAGDLSDYSKYIDGLKVTAVYGGSSIGDQIRALKRGTHIIVATPGRLVDLIERGAARLEGVKNVVMDEADEMLDMGFSESLTTILSQVPEERNTLMFSATMSPEISRIASKYLRNAKEVTVGTRNEGTRNVTHKAYFVRAKDKYAALKRIVDYCPEIYGIVFCRTRAETQEIADKLIQDGYSADSLHGEHSQAQRDLVMQKFRKHHLQILVATDVAARGIDVDDLTHVVNYGLPDSTDVYNHRSGRTGRAGKEGISIAICNLREKGKLRMIEKAIGRKFEQGKLPGGREICEKQLYKLVDDIRTSEINEEEIESYLPGIMAKFEGMEREDIIKHMVSMQFNHFLDYYSDREDIAEPDSREERRGKKSDRRSRGNDDNNREPEPGYSRIFISLGKRDKINPSKIIDMINRRVRGQRVDIGRIDLMPNFSFFEVRQQQARDVVRGLNRTNVGGRKIVVEEAGEKESRNDSRPRQKHNEKKFDRKSDRRAARKDNNDVFKAEKQAKKDDWRQFFE